ncbi:MAG: hypothetical protein A3H57_02625 [Candidatus Taylorbacteria bacterium RIFCSPLOWO2_02_FULL_43_11]|uniref:Uncharacterized protein n=1 Tax=Candidatus Taylorbacteria bacterium RIFCSPHIGHO2_02_FULL_43_32b TaxID=1802306 RepID=A0A1G2MIF8_9BACT|nr:MAG: hypothetical protein A2743_00375 [Candidatus Taylorbacteria bacterium RIFCSPHIGHO2_01_FULL_43_47]OHA22821.1 MAG: hypothetical protein A3C72_02820 [Candidatus Taylorbacteria bacterium RIFCSPHIGHO2_02_FULL_43_32b]OHA30875.1 MAG: hypothetical protein A3B08_01625 [Candidatus Taylorbacteria bacterium RIFCSPLOWO2_01_FULL_43_44]OHA35272.1 MAG: hypothetical protein A3H57_02625 [Candidatus Taylorbacteria bacterium RIFCSPLOWO2_02_FULL_43_11]
MFEKKDFLDENEKVKKTKILLLSAIDEFINYAKRNADFAQNGRLEDGKRTLKGTGFLISGNGLYGSNQFQTPSERAFEGDLRKITGETTKEKTLADSVSKSILLGEAKEFMPEVVLKIEKILQEYDSWGKLYEQKQQEKDWDFEPTPNFIEMSDRICEALETIKTEIT